MTEVMSAPSVGQPEWVELLNLTDGPLDLTGCCLADGGESDHVTFLPDDLMIPPRHHLLLSEAPLDPRAPTAVVLGEDSLVLDEEDPSETLSLFCPRDGNMALIDQAPTGTLESGSRGHSWMVDEEEWASVRNDDPEAWCLAPAELAYPTTEGDDEYGTPGRPNQCELAVGAVPLVGEVLVTEIMVAPDSGAEWFELVSLASQTINLAGCIVTEGGDGPIHEHTLTGERGTTAMEPGQLLVLCHSGLELIPDSEILADYEYTSLTFNNGAPEDLILSCDGHEVDRVTYDWAAADGDKGQSLARDPDDPLRWCLSEDAFWEQGEAAAWGSPGQDNPPCAPSQTGKDYPWVGEVVITELMIAPSNGERFPEWFEVLNVGDRTVDLDGCQVEDDGHTGLLSSASPLPPGHLGILTRDPFDPVCDLTVLGEYGGSVTFNNSSPDRCALSCPGPDGEWVLVDEIYFDWESWDLDKGISLILDTDHASAEANDESSAWCPAPTDVWSCTVDGFTDAGTPLTLPHCGGP